MKNYLFGEGIFFKGEYKEDKVYDLYIQMISCKFKIKKDKIPTIQLKNSSRFISNEYLESSGDEDEVVCLVLTNIDLKLFREQYDVTDLKFISGWKFRSLKGMFDKYINKWIEIKNNATLEDNLGKRTLAKLMLNSLYGKFATALEAQEKSPYLSEEKIVKYKLEDTHEKDGIYIPLGIFVTSYSRDKTIRTSQAIKSYSIKKYGIDKYIYSDTDSIHTTLSIEELKQFCEIDKIKLGAWKHEASFSRAKFIRQKCYIEEINNKLKITCAGMPSSCYDYVNFDNFKSGVTFPGKLAVTHVEGGIKLVESEYTIKEVKF